MSNSGYFTSRHDIMEWVNDLAITHLTKIEQLGSGNIYCQLLDAAYPQKVPLNKVKWQAYLQTDFLHNFKILQAAFERLNINKHVDIQKLAKAKYQDNLEFAQWMRCYLTPKIKDVGLYNALARRNYVQIHLLFVDKKLFDIRQTLQLGQRKDHEAKEPRQLKEIREAQMTNSVVSQVEPPLKTYKSALGPFVVNLQEKNTTAKKEDCSKTSGKENLKPAPKAARNQMLKSAKKPLLNSIVKVSTAKLTTKAAQVVQSDDQQYF